MQPLPGNLALGRLKQANLLLYKAALAAVPESSSETIPSTRALHGAASAINSAAMSLRVQLGPMHADALSSAARGAHSLADHPSLWDEPGAATAIGEWARTIHDAVDQLESMGMMARAGTDYTTFLRTAADPSGVR